VEKIEVAVGLMVIIIGIFLYYISVEIENRIQIKEETIPSFEKSSIVFYNITYVVKAKYLVVNTYKIPIKDYVYVTLPRNTTYQKAYLLSMIPKPTKIERDEDGNTFAVVVVKAEPGEKVWINATYLVKVSGYKIFFNVNESKWPSYSMVAKYTVKTRLWNTEREDVVDLAYKLRKGSTPLEIAINVAKWVQSHISYTILMTRVGSDGALVKTPLGYIIRGDCTEVADVYVTLMRILGIPARTVFGMLLSKHESKLWINMSTAWYEGEKLLRHWGGHMWSQVYLPLWGWVDVELLEEPRVKLGDYSNLHIVFGIEETKYYGTALGNLCAPSYLTLEYIEMKFKPK